MPDSPKTLALEEEDFLRLLQIKLFKNKIKRAEAELNTTIIVGLLLLFVTIGLALISFFCTIIA